LPHYSIHTTPPIQARYSFPTRRSSDLIRRGGTGLRLDKLRIRICPDHLGQDQSRRHFFLSAHSRKCCFSGNHGFTEGPFAIRIRSEEHTSELQSRGHLVCRLLLEKKNK